MADPNDLVRREEQAGHEASTQVEWLTGKTIAIIAIITAIIAILREILLSNINPAGKCFLSIDHEGSTYMGCLLIDDHAFCAQIVKLLQDCRNRPIAEIGSLEVSHTL